MVLLSPLFPAAILLSSAVFASPLQKRIAQTIADSTASWVKACTAAGGGQQCQPVSQTAFMSLLAAGKNCDQQNAADAMVDLAKTLQNDPEMIRLAQIFVQQPRNAPDSLQVPYCQTAPKNPELNGLFHCQFAGSNFAKFSGDQTGNLPLGVTAVTPPGSCPAKKDGPVPDGVQLNTLVQSPGVPTAGSLSSSNCTKVARSFIPPVAASLDPTSNVLVKRLLPSVQLANGQAAQHLNSLFSTLSTTSQCSAGTNACVGGQFAQCNAGTYVLSPCGAGLKCFALPLLLSTGTSITCTTQSDAQTRIANTGATGGLTGGG